MLHNITYPRTFYTATERQAKLPLTLEMLLLATLILASCTPDPERTARSLISKLSHSRGSILQETTDQLIEIGEPAVVPLIEALSNPNDQTRSQAALILGKIRDPRAVEPLILAITDQSGNVRGNAAIALGELGDPRAVDALISAQRRDAKVVFYWLEALDQIGDPRAAEAAIAVLTKNPKHELAKQILEKYLDQANDPWAKSLAKTDPADYSNFFLLLEKYEGGYLSISSSIAHNGPLLEQLVRSSSPLERGGVNIASILGTAEVEHVIVFLQSDDAQFRRSVLFVLYNIGGTQAAEAIVRSLADPDESIRKDAFELLYSMYVQNNETALEQGLPPLDKAVPTLIDILEQEKNNNIRSRAAELLGYTTDERVYQTLIDKLETDKPIRPSIIYSIGMLKKSDAIPILERFFSDNDEQVRRSAFMVLAANSGEEAIPILLQAIQDERKEVGETALDALISMDDEGVKPLLDAFKKRDLKTVAIAHKFFIRRGEPGSEPVLVEALLNYGDMMMASVYLNSRNEILEQGARRWAAENGYVIAGGPGPGGGSSTRWGSNP
jgi:HEAT repeat protein